MVALLIDFDGVIVDSEPLKWECWKRAFKKFGIEVEDSIHAKIMGMKKYDVARRICEIKGLNVDLDEVVNLRDSCLREIEKSYPMREGWRELLSIGVKKAIVTSSKREIVAYYLKDYLKKVNVIVDSRSVKKGKPDPEPYLLALKLLGEKEGIVIEDSPQGVLAGKRAGCLTIGVRHSMNERIDLMADYTAKDLKEVVKIVNELILNYL